MVEGGRQKHGAKNALTGVMRQIHIYSAMPVLVLMLFFAVTGIYLNHPDLEPSGVKVSQQSIELPTWVAGLSDWSEQYASHSFTLLHWLNENHDISGVDFEVEWDDMDQLLIFDLSGPNGNTLVEAYIEDGVAEVETRAFSLLATLNNVHRSKHVTGFWLFLSDVSAICMLLFCLSGFWLVLVNRMERNGASVAMFLGSSLFVFIVYLMH